MKLLVAVICVFLFLRVATHAQCDIVRIAPDDGAYNPWTYSWIAVPGFGGRVAAYENRIVVGHPRDSTLAVDSGAVYVYEKLGRNAYQSQKLYPSDPRAFVYFGGGDLHPVPGTPGSAGDIAVWGDIIVVGVPRAFNTSPYWPPPGRSTGAVYVFELIEGAWVETVRLHEEPQPTDGRDRPFGTHVALRGSLLFVDSHWSAMFDGPTVHVYQKTGGAWTEVYAIPGEGNLSLTAGRAAIGNTIWDRQGDQWVQSAILPNEIHALDGETAVAPVGSNVEVYELVNENWLTTAVLTGDTGERVWAVDLFHDAILIGRDGWTRCADENDAGAAWIHERENGTWGEGEKLTAYDGIPCDMYGRSVALYQDLAIVGASGEDDHGGAAYLTSVSSGSCGTLAVSNGMGTYFDDATIVAADGGLQISTLDAPNILARHIYWLLGTTSGTSPGVQVGGYRVPLNIDEYLLSTFLNPNQGWLWNNYGVLDANARAQVIMAVPPDPSLPVPMALNHAYLVFNDAGQIVHVSNASHLSIR